MKYLKHLRADVFQDRKCVHLKLSKEVHSALRARLFMHGVSMQDAFDEFARQLVEGKKSASVILESLIDKKLKEAVAGKFQDSRNKKFSELDAEALYSLIDPHEKRAEKNEIDLEEDG